MGSKLKGTKTGRQRLRSFATGDAPALPIERLESRRLFCGSVPVTPVPAEATLPPAQIVAPSLSAARPVSAQVIQPVPAGPDALHAADAKGPAQDVVVANAADAPVQRLSSGGHFAGFDHPPRPGDAGDDSPAPDDRPAPKDVGVSPATPVIPGGVKVSGKPGVITPSFTGAGGPGTVAGEPPTPLALTPARPAIQFQVVDPGWSVPTPAVVGPVVSKVSDNVAVVTSTPHVALGTFAMAMPANTAFADGQAIAVQVAGAMANASNKAVDALALMASPESVRVAVAYNFIHFNPAAMLNDAIASFTNESASLAPMAAPDASSGRAWTITAAVVGLDLLFVGYWYQKTRRENAVRLKRAGSDHGTSGMDPCHERLVWPRGG
jgi:hypothetical protein